MKKSFLLSGLCTVVSMGLHLYLTHRAHSLTSGEVTSSSICQVHSQLSCDKALLSPYSHFMGVPVSTWGFGMHFALLCLIVLLSLKWTKSQKTFLDLLKALSLFSAFASLGMWGLSWFVLHSFCLLCCGLYVLSFVVAFSLWFSDKGGMVKSVMRGFRPSAWKPASGVMALWLGAVFLSHLVFMKVYQTRSVQQMVQAHFQDWLFAPVKNIPGKALLSFNKNPHTPTSLVLTEFADFLCSHCRRVHDLLKILKSSRPDIEIQYFSFPLDRCQGQSATCFLTRAVYCADLQNQGPGLQDRIYQHQKNFMGLFTGEEFLSELKQITSDMSLDHASYEVCLNSPEAREVVENQMHTGQTVGIEGTPTLFVNGKKIRWQYLFETLKHIQKHLQTGRRL